MTKILTYIGVFKQSLLAEELQAAFPSWGGVTSEGTSRLYGKPDGSQVYIHAPDDADEVEVQSVIDSHNPNDKSLGEIKQVNIDDANLRLKTSALSDKTPQEIYDIVQARIDSWTSLADAKTDFREWMPLLFAGMMWMVKRD
jgi:hypothetical protein